MYIKKELKKRIVISSLTVLMLALTIVGSSYALFLDVKTDTNDQVLSVGDLQVTFNGGDAINLEDVVPMSDEDAFSNKENEYIFTVLNKGNVPYVFDVLVKDNETYIENKLSHEYIKYNLNLEGSRLLSETDDGLIKTYQLDPGKTKLFNLKIYIPEAKKYKLPNNIFDKEVHLKIEIDGKAGVLNENIEKEIEEGLNNEE